MRDHSPLIVIVGAGAAGIACALAAAKKGCKVLLLEQFSKVGGTVAHALIHTLGGLFDDQGEILNEGITNELIDRLKAACPLTVKRRIGKTWTLSVDPGVYLEVVQQWLSEYQLIHQLCHANINHISAQAGRIDTLVFEHDGKSHAVQPYILIDASGHAVVVRDIAADLVKDGEALAGLIVQLRGVAANTLVFPRGVGLLHNIKKAGESGQLPKECSGLWLDLGVYEDEAYVKFNLSESMYDASRMTQIARQLVTYLQTLNGFSDAYINTIGALGIRDGGFAQGEYVLTEKDVKQGRQFDDAVCQACWPIEYWHPKNGVQLEYLPAGVRYQIPLRALKVATFKNLYVAGKCFSAEPLALASARVAGTCWAMGEGLIQTLFQEASQ